LAAHQAALITLSSRVAVVEGMRLAVVVVLAES
jgi:hypothetical protein